MGFSPDARGCSRRGPLGVFLVFSLAKCAGHVLHPRKGSSARGFSSEIQIHSDLRLLIYLFIYFFSLQKGEVSAGALLRCLVLSAALQAM